MAQLVIHPARLVRTLDRSRPTAEAVAIRDGQIVGVGSVAELERYGDANVDQRFADRVLVPGFVEAHAHSYAGALWQSPYVGFFTRIGPDGRRWEACRSVEDVLQRLLDAERELPDATTPLTAWGFDPIYLPGARLRAVELDRVSRTRPIFVLHASNHLAAVNSALIEIDRLAEKTAVPGVLTGADGRPTGELHELPAMFQASSATAHLFLRDRGAEGVRTALGAFGDLAQRTGCTTVADLGATPLNDPAIVDALIDTVGAPEYPIRLSMFHICAMGPLKPAEELAFVEGLGARSGAKLRFGNAKFILDGSIQGFTARLQPPGYLDGRPNGMWVTAPERLRETFRVFHEAGHLVHAHCNGDEATELFLDVVAEALRHHPRPDHRHTVTHSQMTTPAQYRRMAALGLCANIFANHTYYWGDQHRDLIVGPDRAPRMNAAATALAHGITISLHSDEPVTPLGALGLMANAVERRTATGELLGAEERITPAQALEAVTLGAARMLHLDHEIGSIEAGKRADLAVLDEDPLAVDADRLRSIAVRATVVGGTVVPVRGG